MNSRHDMRLDRTLKVMVNRPVGASVDLVFDDNADLPETPGQWNIDGGDATSTLTDAAVSTKVTVALVDEDDDQVPVGQPARIVLDFGGGNLLSYDVTDVEDDFKLRWDGAWSGTIRCYVVESGVVVGDGTAAIGNDVTITLHMGTQGQLTSKVEREVWAGRMDDVGDQISSTGVYLVSRERTYHVRYDPDLLALGTDDYIQTEDGRRRIQGVGECCGRRRFLTMRTSDF